ncbi:MAG: hypothetical protein KIT48_09045 [Pseudolabrys sp.]|nr:hypothetical protein [Pseudolabrys sp.]
MTKTSVRAKGPSRSKTGLALRELLGDLPLLNGENAEAFDKFCRDVSRFFSPTNIIEEIYARNYVDLSWEIERYRRDLTHFINANLYWGLLDVLHRLTDYEKAEKLAKGWVSAKSQEVQVVDQMLADAGLSRDHIRAQTMAVKIEDIERFNHLIVVLETRRDSLIREFERFRATYRRLHSKGAEIAEVVELGGPHRLASSVSRTDSA